MTVNDTLQDFCREVLQAMPSTLQGEVEDNGVAGSKLSIPADLGYHYLYLGVTDKGIVAYFAEAFKPSRAEILWGPKTLKGAGNLTAQQMARVLTQALYARMPELSPKEFLTRLANQSA